MQLLLIYLEQSLRPNHDDYLACRQIKEQIWATINQEGTTILDCDSFWHKHLTQSQASRGRAIPPTCARRGHFPRNDSSGCILNWPGQLNASDLVALFSKDRVLRVLTVVNLIYF